MITDKKPSLLYDQNRAENSYLLPGESDGLYASLTYQVIGALYEVHKELGSVHKEIIADFGTSPLTIKRRIFTRLL